jgi:hypothetical protein
LFVELPKGMTAISPVPRAILIATRRLSSALPAKSPVPQDLAKLLPNSAINLTKTMHREFGVHLERQEITSMDEWSAVCPDTSDSVLLNTKRGHD